MSDRLRSRAHGRAAAVLAFATAAAMAVGAAAQSGAPAARPKPVSCSSMSVFIGDPRPEAPATATVNGVQVGVYDTSTSLNLDPFLEPGVNTLAFSFEALPKYPAFVTLDCLPPGGADKVTILRFRPAEGRLQTQTQANIVR